MTYTQGYDEGRRDALAFMPRRSGDDSPYWRGYADGYADGLAIRDRGENP